VFEAQLKWLQDNGYTVIPLRTLVNYLREQGPPATKSVVITPMIAHKPVYSDMLPWAKVQDSRDPVCLSVCGFQSHAPYAIPEQLRITANCLSICSSHLLHPNFKKEKKKLNPENTENRQANWEIQASLEKRFVSQWTCCLLWHL